MAQCLFICDVNLSIEEDLSILLVKEYDLKIHVKGYHAYMTKWTSKNGELLKARPEPENEYDKYADIFLKEGLHISSKPFCIFYVQAMKTAAGLNNGQKSKLRRWRRTTDSLHTSFFWRSKIC